MVSEILTSCVSHQFDISRNPAIVENMPHPRQRIKRKDKINSQKNLVPAGGVKRAKNLLARDQENPEPGTEDGRNDGHDDQISENEMKLSTVRRASSESISTRHSLEEFYKK